MELKLLFPSDFFNQNAVDDAYASEYEVAKFIGFDCLLFNYDEFLQTGKINIKKSVNGDILLYRGWMFNISEYYLFDNELYGKGYILINNIDLYEAMHHFDQAYVFLKNKINTPKTIFVTKRYDGWEYFNSDAGWLPLDLKNLFDNYFIMKDNVKSVKGTDFPSRISVNITSEYFDDLVDRFKKYRGDLYTGQIVLKQYEELKRYDGIINEWRVFYFLGRVVTVSRNNNQPSNSNIVPESLVNNPAILGLPSMFYTIDFAETVDGNWIVIDTGDGQVSGLSPNQNILEFYTKLQNYWNEKYKV